MQDMNLLDQSQKSHSLNNNSNINNLNHPSRDVQPTGSQFNFISSIMSIVLCPFTAFASCVMVRQNEEGVVSYWGEYSGTLRSPGIHFSIPWGRNVQMVSTKRISHEIPKLKIVDKNGNPLLISAVIVFSIVNTRRAVFEVNNPIQYVTTQAETVLKQIISRYPYETNDDTPCLKTEADLIGKELCSSLQEKIHVAGAFVYSYQLKEISYSSEIAAGMLRRQQASSIIAARQTIVQGAVDIAVEAIESLKQKNIEMNERERAHLVTNILTVICSDKDATPTVPLGGLN